jgi:hypothetical protein
MTALIGGIGSLIGGIAGAGASLAAAKLQADAAKDAIRSQEQMFAKVRADLQPFIAAGGDATNLLMERMGDITRRFEPTMAELEATPGYQWALDQSLKHGQNNFASRGLGSSGAAMKGAQDRAFGLASTTYQQQLQNHMAQNMQEYNMLMGPAGLGQAAAAGQASVGQQFAAQIGQHQQNVGTAWGAGAVGASNALNSGFQNAMGWGQLYNMQGPGGIL